MPVRRPLYEMTRGLTGVVSGRLPADVVIRDGRWVNVCSGEIIERTDVAVHGCRIAYCGPDAGAMIGPDTLPKFYSLHMLVLPGAIMALIGLHLYLVVRLGVSSPPWSRTAAGRERGPEAGAREGLIREPATEGDEA